MDEVELIKVYNFSKDAGACAAGAPARLFHSAPIRSDPWLRRSHSERHSENTYDNCNLKHLKNRIRSSQSSTQGDTSRRLFHSELRERARARESKGQRGASVDVPNNQRGTPLYLAVTNGNAAIARLLIAHGASVHIADTNGRTVSHAASRRGHLGVVKLPLQRGADINVLNKAGGSAGELASENGQS